MVDVVLVAPVRAYRDALAGAFEQTEFRIVAHAGTYVEAVSCITPRHPAIALVDFALVELPALLQSVRRDAPRTRVVGFGIEASRDHSEAVVRAAEAGLAGFIDADQPVEDVISAVRLALRGQSSCSPRIAALLLQSMQRRPQPPALPGSSTLLVPLTPRECVVADLVSRGLTNRQIATRLVVGESTVKTHVHSILHKLSVTHRSEIDPALLRTG